MPPVRQVSFCLLNARSVCDVKQAGKATVTCDLIEDNGLDILAITETWLRTDDSISTGRTTPAGYQLLHVRERTAPVVVSLSSASLPS
ncbi:hypothetical protein NP493_353g06015 [Ridgeia piscesae]|uniref:Uncharacterized protein n=1 Tax=Ridgeia piscesae TaxID=27915 RepID=A0AAD9L349_RIDPI|nr:hypothetical protein NP493_353g06015 [Ridgeia piscesae]